MKWQLREPNAATGQPVFLYHYPPGRVHSHELPIDREYVVQLEADLEEWVMHWQSLFSNSLSFTLFPYQLPLFLVV